jgi:hypothetical protein
VVSLLVVADGAFAVAASRDDGRGTCLAQRTAEAIGVVSFVAQQVSHTPGAFEQAGAALMSLTLPGVSIKA